MLSDTNIRQEIAKRQNSPDEGIFIDPFEDKCLTPVGYDLRVGKQGFSWKNKEVVDIELDRKIRIEPNDTVIVQTLESVSLSKGFSGTIHSMVSKVIPKGLSHISTTIDPGWTGKLLISVHNFYDIPTELRFDEKFCTICFYTVNLEATKGTGNPSDRDDIWDGLLEKAREQEKRVKEERKKEERRRRQKNNLRIFLLLVISACALFTGLVISPKDPSLGAAIAAVLAVIVPIVLESLKPG
ncbi:MAG: deoxycytidine deaminase [Leptolyngbyaceae cyanobacterium RU_5_1]|nr:deoxycytidine deaminase [Leptolyngbyaceae cyanobacterium RU_5_1]